MIFLHLRSREGVIAAAALDLSLSQCHIAFRKSSAKLEVFLIVKVKPLGYNSGKGEGQSEGRSRVRKL